MIKKVRALGVRPYIQGLNDNNHVGAFIDRPR